MTDAQIMKAVRTALDLNQQQMAERCGYGDKSRVSDIETGKFTMSGPARKLLEELYKNGK